MSNFNEAIDCINVVQPVQQDVDQVIATVFVQPVCRLPMGWISRICIPKNRGSHVNTNAVHESYVSDELVRWFTEFSQLIPVIPAGQTVVYQVSPCTATKVLVYVHPKNTVTDKEVGKAYTVLTQIVALSVTPFHHNFLSICPNVRPTWHHSFGF